MLKRFGVGASFADTTSNGPYEATATEHRPLKHRRTLVSVYGSSEQHGQQMTLTVDNLGTPDYVDLSVSLCEKSNFSTSMMCEDEGDIYEDESESMKVFPVFTVEYWIKIVAWDETKDNREPGGDLTNVRVKLAGNVDSNDDRTEPETMSNGDKLERKVCETDAKTVAPTPWTCSSSMAFQGIRLTYGLVPEYDFVCDNELRLLVLGWISPTLRQ